MGKRRLMRDGKLFAVERRSDGNLLSIQSTISDSIVVLPITLRWCNLTMLTQLKISKKEEKQHIHAPLLCKSPKRSQEARTCFLNEIPSSNSHFFARRFFDVEKSHHFLVDL